jgi:copper chaperone CopZ
MVIEKFKVPGIQCDHCIEAINVEVSDLDGVTSVMSGGVDEKTIMVEHGGQLTTDQLVMAINEAGYMDVEKLGTVTTS